MSPQQEEAGAIIRLHEARSLRLGSTYGDGQPSVAVAGSGRRALDPIRLRRARCAAHRHGMPPLLSVAAQSGFTLSGRIALSEGGRQAGVPVGRDQCLLLREVSVVQQSLSDLEFGTDLSIGKAAKYGWSAKNCSACQKQAKNRIESQLVAVTQRCLKHGLSHVWIGDKSESKTFSTFVNRPK